MDKLQKLEEEQQFERWELLTTEEKERRKEETLIIIGGMSSRGSLARKLLSEEIENLETFQAQGRYIDLGFNTFAEYLNSDYCLNFSKSSFYEKRKLLKKEGKEVFDILQEAKVSLESRKLLTESDYGDVVVEGDIVTIAGEEADLSDLKLIKSLIVDLVDKKSELVKENKKQKETLQKGTEDHKKYKQRLKDAKEFNSKTPLQQSVHIAIGSFANLATELENADLHECNEFAERSLKLFATQYNRINQLLSEKLAQSDEFDISETKKDRIASLLDD